MLAGPRRMPRPALAGFCAVLLVTTVVGSAWAEPLAVLASVKGRVEVVASKGGAAQRGAFGRALERGDKVTVGAGGAATVFFNDGNVIELGEKSAVTIGGRVGGKGRGGAPGLPGEVYAGVSKYVTGGSRQSGLVALSNLRSADERAPLLLAPRKSELLDGRPAFAWRGVGGATRYRVTLSGSDGERWSRETPDTTLPYPADAEALPAGSDYLWEVRALSDTGELEREESYFHVLEVVESEAVRDNLAKIAESAGGADKPAARFLSGSYLFGRGLYHEAAVHFEALSRLTPESSAPHEALGNVYRAVGLMDQAAEQYQRALALTREP